MWPRSGVRALLGTAFAAVVAGAIAIDFARGHGDIVAVDFHTYLAAAMVGVRDGWSHVYDQGMVAAAQHALVPQQWAQPFLSTPPVALLVVPLAPLPFHVAYYLWGALNLAAFVAALAWSTTYRGVVRWIAAAAAVVPWWVLHSVHVGQVSPLMAASVLVAWRLLRERRDVAAGLVLALLLLKPNVALLVPVALLFAGRARALGAWLGASGAVAVVSLALIGPHGAEAYVNALTHLSAGTLRGASQLTVATAFTLTPAGSVVARALILVVALAVMYRLRGEPGMALAAGAVGSLVLVTYLHASDLCLFAAAGWIVWHERRDPAWRALLAGIWVLATPFLDGSALAPALDRWVACELVVLAALAVDAFVRPHVTQWRAGLTGWAASRRQATA